MHVRLTRYLSQQAVSLRWTQASVSVLNNSLSVTKRGNPSAVRQSRATLRPATAPWSVAQGRPSPPSSPAESHQLRYPSNRSRIGQGQQPDSFLPRSCVCIQTCSCVSGESDVPGVQDRHGCTAHAVETTFQKPRWRSAGTDHFHVNHD